MDLELVLIDSDARRTFSYALRRWQPALLPLRNRFAALSIAGEPLQRIVAYFRDFPLAYVTIESGNLPTSLDFIAGYGEDRDFRRPGDLAFLETVAAQFREAVRRSPLAAATREQICSIVEGWRGELPSLMIGMRTPNQAMQRTAPRSDA
jgi:hypothetical protein